MEHKRAMVTATAAAVTLVATSFGFAATRLAATTPDNAGHLESKVARPVQYVVEDVPGPVITVPSARPSASAGGTPAEARVDDEQEDAPTATFGEPTSTTIEDTSASSSDDDSHESTEQHAPEDHQEPDDD